MANQKPIADKPWLRVIGVYSNSDLVIAAQCIKCPTVKSFVIKPEDWNHWIAGGLIQNVFPNMSVDDREFFISGVCPTCWNKLFDAE